MCSCAAQRRYTWRSSSRGALTLAADRAQVALYFEIYRISLIDRIIPYSVVL